MLLALKLISRLTAESLLKIERCKAKQHQKLDSRVITTIQFFFYQEYLQRVPLYHQSPRRG